jgi:hypothetical protein
MRHNAVLKNLIHLKTKEDSLREYFVKNFFLIIKFSVQLTRLIYLTIKKLEHLEDFIFKKNQKKKKNLYFVKMEKFI